MTRAQLYGTLVQPARGGLQIRSRVSGSDGAVYAVYRLPLGPEVGPVYTSRSLVACRAYVDTRTGRGVSR